MRTFSIEQKMALYFLFGMVLIVWGCVFGLTRVNTVAIENGYTITTDKDNHTQYTPPDKFKSKDTPNVEKETK